MTNKSTSDETQVEPNAGEKTPRQTHAVKLGSLEKLTSGAGRQYEDGRKYSERQ